ncbi:MAG: hypothetical protein ACI89X_000319 [Planctomycetota bacterium]
MHTFAPHLVLVAILVLTAPTHAQEPASLTIPAFCGYSYPNPSAAQRDRKTGAVKTCAGELHFYFESATPGQVKVEIERLPKTPAAAMEISVGPHPSSKAASAKGTLATNDEKTWMGTFGLHLPGRHKLIIKSTDGTPLVGIKSIVLSGSPVNAITVERRNASSVHLGYDVPKDNVDDIEWFYCELTPKTDPLWTYYMATGWHRGYFGMQVNSKTERRIIFSVWDSGNEAIDRKKVKADDLVQLLDKGKDVHAGGFGNEGTGGHSHLVHDWKLGDTIRFLVRAQPEGKHTTYTGWFSHLHGDAKDSQPDPWQLVASFKAPRDGKHLLRPYSFSENFSGRNGDRDRQCDYGNVWLRTKGGEWLAVRGAKFTHDGHGKLRSDRRGGVRDGRFFLQHGNFATKPMRRNSKVTLPGKAGNPPADTPK